MTILDQLAGHARERVAEEKKIIPSKEIKRQALSLPKGNFAFESARRKPDISFICECKKASPSKGIIDPSFPYMQIAKEYEAAGADCISVLTEPKWFLGRDEYLKEIAGAVSIPCLTAEKLRNYLCLCDELGLSALVEAHDEAEVLASLRAGARIIGVNNRNLKDFSVDTGNSARLRRLIPEDVLFVSESGVSSAEDVAKLREIGADAVLIGETLMRSPDKEKKLSELRGTV